MSRATIRVDDGSTKRTTPAGITTVRSSADVGLNPSVSPPGVSVTKQFGTMTNDVLDNGVSTITINAFVDANSPIHHLDIEGMSGSATSCTDRILNSGAATWSSAAGSALAKGTYFGKECINIDACQKISVSNTMGNLPQYYTMFAIWYPRVTNSGWRTFWRGSNDHQLIINNNATDLGFYSGRDGAFRDTGYNISIEWQTIIMTSAGTTASGAYGTSTYYINGTNVGTVDRVKSGTTGDSFGWESQAPGYFMEIGILGKVLNSTEIADLHSRLNRRMVGGSGGGASWTDAVSQSSVSSGYSVPINHVSKRTPIITSKPSRQEIILANQVRARIKTTGQVNTRLQDTVAVQLAASGGGGGGGSGGGSDSAVASTIKQIWY